MADIFDGMEKLGKGEFISIPNYTNSKGEVANYIINGNVTYQNLKENDLKKLQACTDTTLQEISNEKNIDVAIVRTALAEMTESAIKNLNAENEDRTAQSKAQSDAYINFGKGLKMHKETEQFQIDGLIVKKTVVVEGVYPIVNSRPKTLAKKAIEKKLELQKAKYRSFIVEKCEYVNMSGMTVNP